MEELTEMSLFEWSLKCGHRGSYCDVFYELRKKWSFYFSLNENNEKCEIQFLKMKIMKQKFWQLKYFAVLRSYNNTLKITHKGKKKLRQIITDMTTCTRKKKYMMRRRTVSLAMHSKKVERMTNKRRV